MYPPVVRIKVAFNFSKKAGIIAVLHCASLWQARMLSSGPHSSDDIPTAFLSCYTFIKKKLCIHFG
jgi:hypothetical protein